MSKLEILKQINAMAEFNRWCDFAVDTVARPNLLANSQTLLTVIAA